MKKIILSLLVFAFVMLGAQAKNAKSEFVDIINDSGVDMESISISIKSTDNGKSIYALNEKFLMTPASVQKIYTTPVIVDTLGEDYEFVTELFSRSEDEFVIKLSGDPYLSSSDLKKLISTLKPDTRRIYIDDSALDKKFWGEGWQWDDDMNTLMPRFGAYNLDKNLIKLTIMPSEEGKFATIINPSKYPLVFFNNVETGDKTKIDIRRDNAISTNTLMLSGKVARPTTVYIPTINLQRYFNVQLSRVLEERKIYLKENFIVGKKQPNDNSIATITHKIDRAVDDILKRSNNLVSETMFKLAGAKHMGIATGSDAAGIKMFNDYCENLKIDNSRIRVADASGVSKNNLVSTDFVSEFLVLNKDNSVYNYLATPGQGTLTHRMLPLKGNLKAKTGTLSDVSSIAGFLTTKRGKNLAFCIIINDMKLSNSDKKMLEDFIIREAYLRL